MRKKVNVTTLKEKKPFFLKKNWGSISDDVGVDETVFLLQQLWPLILENFFLLRW